MYEYFLFYKNADEEVYRRYTIPYERLEMAIKDAKYMKEKHQITEYKIYKVDLKFASVRMVASSD